MFVGGPPSGNNTATCGGRRGLRNLSSSLMSLFNNKECAYTKQETEICIECVPQ